jgi:uncharacterized protein (DUF2336 family)
VTPHTLKSIDLALAELRRRQSIGQARQPGEVTPLDVARIAEEIGRPISERTYRRFLRTAETKFTRRLREAMPDALDLFRRIKP